MLTQYIIYDRPRDHPEGWVVREWHIGPGIVQPGNVWVAGTLEEARQLIPPGMIPLGRAPDDDPKIVEVWT